MALDADGVAQVAQSLVFAATRPLADVPVTLEVLLLLGRRRERPAATLQLTFSLLELLHKSPAHPRKGPACKAMRSSTLPGVKVRGKGGGLESSHPIIAVTCRQRKASRLPLCDVQQQTLHTGVAVDS